MFDIEERLSREDVDALVHQIKHARLNLIVIADWFDLDLFLATCAESSSRELCERGRSQSPKSSPSPKKPGTTSQKTRKSRLKKQSPLIPNNLMSLNQVLAPFNMEIAYKSISASFEFSPNKQIHFDSGTFLTRIPKGTFCFSTQARVESPSPTKQFFSFRPHKFPVAALYSNVVNKHLLGSDSIFENREEGKIMFFGDSSCFEHNEQGNCLVVFDIFIHFIRE